MVGFKLSVVYIFGILHVSICTRRIQEGEIVTSQKPYVVYLVKAPTASHKYDFWLCGGALVSELYVVTSAACIKDVNYLYVIAGYDKYVTDDQIELDPCTSQKKKKVIYTCFPSGYDIQYDKLDKWALIDIGVVKVESPYDFTDESYKTVCSYIPAVIPISYEAKYQEPGTDAIVLGWGHLFKWRKESDRSNHNQRVLNYAPVIIIDKEKCKKDYEDYENMTEVIDKYMICSMGDGNIDDKGEAIISSDPKQKECDQVVSDETRKSLKYVDPECVQEDTYHEYGEMDNSRRQMKRSKLSRNMVRNKNKTLVTKDISGDNSTSASYRTSLSNITTASTKARSSKKSRVLFTDKPTRRYGICQNDHGGPLVTWVGAHEILIGIASVFKVSEESECKGPYLYTSTQCSGAFLDCILVRAEWPQSSTKNRSTVSRRALCKKDANDPGQSTVERHISWLYHPHGAAANELSESGGRNGAEENDDHDTVTAPQPEKYGISVPNAGYPSNGGNPADSGYQQYPSNAGYPPNEGYAQNGGYAPNVGDPQTGGYPSNDGYLPNVGYPSNGKYSPNGGYPPNDGYPQNNGYPPNGENIPNGAYPTNGGIPPNGENPPNEGYFPNQGYPPQEGYLPNEGFPPNVAYQPIAGNPSNIAYSPEKPVVNQMYTENVIMLQIKIMKRINLLENILQ